MPSPYELGNHNRGPSRLCVAQPRTLVCTHHPQILARSARTSFAGEQAQQQSGPVGIVYQSRSRIDPGEICRAERFLGSLFKRLGACRARASTVKQLPGTHP